MKCVREDLKAHITDVLVGEAEASVKEQVLSHLEECPSCQEDRDAVAKVLGLLKEAPPWTSDRSATAASESADTLSVIQRQKIESLAGRRSSPPAIRKTPTSRTSWFALAASLSAVGIALILARKDSETAMEISAPVPAASSINRLPQAPEAAGLYGQLPPAPPLTTPAAQRVPDRMAVPMAPEARRELQRRAQPEQAKALSQAAEANEFQPLKKDAEGRLRDQGTVAGGAPGARAPAAEPPAARADRVPVPLPTAAPPKEEKLTASESVDVVGQAPLLETRSSAVGVRGKAKTNERHAPPEKQSQGGLDRDEKDRLRSLGYLGEPRADKPAPAAPRDMFFEAKGTNPFIATDEDALATFGLDVDTASYTLTRNYLNRGTLPPPSAVRVEEFVNAFPNNVSADRGSEGGSAFAVRVDGAPNPLHEGYQILRVAMKAKDVDPRERKAAHLTFVIDVSGSMAAENRLELVKQSLALLVDKLDERDTIGIVVYGTNGRRVLSPTSVSNRDRIMSVINRLHPEGSTNLEDGLNLGYEMAVESFTRGASNRVVLCTDGVANTGETEADGLLSRIRSEAKRGIDMMALGFGMGNYNDALLQRLADEGNGQYAYIDDLGEARAFFLRRLTSVLEVVARDAKAQVEFNPERVERYRLLGYEKRDVADRDFRNDSVDAGEINSGHSVTALFEVKLKGGPGAGKIGTARIRYKTGPRSEGVEFAREISDEAVVKSFEKASPAFRTAYVAARFAEHLRKSYWVKDESLASVLSLAEELPEATQTNELTDLIRKAVRLQKAQIREDW